MKIACKICEWHGDTQRKLAKHVRDAHKLTSKSYYDSHLGCEGVCEYCGAPTVFKTISLGYSSSCINCKSQKTKDYRKAQREDPQRHEKFVAKVKENQTRIWQNRQEIGQSESIRTKIGNAIKKNNQLLSKEEMKAKYGWLSKLSIEEKEVWKTEVMFNTGAHKWKKHASHEMLSAASRKALATRINTTLEMVELMRDKVDEWKTYHQVV